ncbi:hypothetical protein EDD17DRAFT_1770558 [Pisolithus thermaeus]|nr:hypothetical protein EDD17DRAFT_1770558 [Pisolithus thermaeus]
MPTDRKTVILESAQLHSCLSTLAQANLRYPTCNLLVRDGRRPHPQSFIDQPKPTVLVPEANLERPPSDSRLLQSDGTPGTLQVSRSSPSPTAQSRPANRMETPRRHLTKLFQPERKLSSHPPSWRSLRANFLASWLNVLLVCFSISWALNFALPDQHTLIFIFSFLAIILLAKLLAFATDELLLRVGQTPAGLTNVKLGNAVELIISIIALTKYELPIVRSSRGFHADDHVNARLTLQLVIGSILSTLLLVLSMCFFAGGLRFSEQGLRHVAAQLNYSLLTISVIGVLLPGAIYMALQGSTSLSESDVDDQILKISHAVTIILPFGEATPLPACPDHPVFLDQLALFIGERVRRLARQSKSHDSILLDRVVDNLSTLANYFRDIFRNQHAIVHVKEAIKPYRYVPQFRPAGHLSLASSLHDLPQCLADRYRHQPTEADLDEAIALEQDALRLLTPGDSGHDISRRCLMAYLRLKISSQLATSASDVTHCDIKQVVRDITFETLKTMPTRLLHTDSGSLCNRDMQISQFISSQQYKQLLSSCAACDSAQQMELIRAEVSRYFQYAMLSHRWSAGEPLFRDVEGSQIYDMSTNGGLGKLQAFCLVASERGYLWAWSDTCCIDKESSAELQEAIGSMFLWYRRSALTIVYLFDVPDTGSFVNSEWFRRGWTLQELLAPPSILFYTRTWSLYKNVTSSNHKADFAVLEELERVTGVESQFLTNFSPGMEDTRSRLQWASLRATARPEDIAYSLFGIFNLHLPIMYGESAENALGRLLSEIILRSGDISVLDWVGEPSSFHSCFPAHVTSYQRLPSPPPQSISEEPEMMLYAEQPASSTTLRTLYRSLTKLPLPRFLNRRLILPCITYRVTEMQRRMTSPSTRNYTYRTMASGLRPLEIALPEKLDVTMSRGALLLARPWYSKLLCPFANLHTMTEEQLLFTLEQPFNALLLTELPHNEYRRIASSNLITAQAVDSASILQRKVRILDIV